MEEDLLNLLGRKDYVPADVPELLGALKLPAAKKRTLQKTLKQLERAGEVVRIKDARYVLPEEADLIPGRIQITRQGRGFLLPDAPGLGEIAIPASQTGIALHDDHVLVRRDVRPRGMRSKPDDPDTGSVVRVLARRRTRIVGTLRSSERFHYVVPDDSRMQKDIYVPPARDVGREAQSGDKVVVELGEWESRHTNPEGVIVEVLGPPTAEGVDMLAILRHYDLPLQFPPKVLQEVRRFGSEVGERDLAGRTDCRDHPVVTIDPEDAKDFDDAFSLERSGSKRWKLRVHIADVSHYVSPGSVLDVEARKRGNSTYLVDRVVPMLPEALSNELCSLKPRVDRLTKCVEFLINDDGKVVRSRCYPAVIHSRRRFSYEAAMEVMEGSPGDDIEEMLQQADRLAQKIRRRRFKDGSLELDFPESKIRLDDRGRVADIVRVEYDRSHQLIEEFMLLANEAVAGRLMKLKQPSIYRVHENPDPSRLKEYREEVLSHNVPCGNLEKTAEVQKLLRKLGELAIGPALKIGFLKSLMRARYAVEPLGHYGLAKDKYTHFTSPIRRYADLVVHRSLFEDRSGKKASLKETADHISATERNSADAERDSKSVKLYAYLQAQIKSGKPRRYEALVTDVRNFGIFIDVIDLGMGGLVPLSLLNDDFYEFDATRVRVHGRRTRRTIGLGDRLEVEVAKVDPLKKQVDFRLVPDPARKRGGKRRPADPKGNSRTSKSARKRPAAKGARKRRSPAANGNNKRNAKQSTPKGAEKQKSTPGTRAARKEASPSRKRRRRRSRSGSARNR
ncbi:MAG: ribonuclease R [Akkermansiaceae bacterium]|nr:ribonuclease R [Akkermansiaceae bacterium]